jgi:dihydroorotate dehydrogenase (NAD+) catalytic subunit
VFGGLSGPAIKPVALRMVYQVWRAGLGLPICGIGGIQNGADAIEFLLAGANVVQVGTQSFIDPASSERIVREIGEYCIANGVADVKELVGALRV